MVSTTCKQKVLANSTNTNVGHEGGHLVQTSGVQIQSLKSKHKSKEINLI